MTIKSVKKGNNALLTGYIRSYGSVDDTMPFANIRRRTQFILIELGLVAKRRKKKLKGEYAIIDRYSF